MIRLLLGRHGETDWNREGRWQGHVDRSLNDTGREQARALAARIAVLEPAAIYSSDLARAWETAAPVAELTDLDLTPDARLREVDVGSWEGYTREQVQQRDPRRYAAYERDKSFGYPDGETFAALKRRSVAAIDDICAQHSSGQVLAIVSHGGTIRSVLSAALDLPRAARILAPGPANGSLTQVWWDGGRLRVISYNDTGHLPPLV